MSLQHLDRIGLRPLAVLLAVLLAGCERGVLAPQGPVGTAQKTMMLNALGIMLAVAVPTIIGTLAVAWWFRASNRRARYRPEFVFSGQIEMVVWAVPAMVVVLLGGIAWVGSHELEPSKPLASSSPALTVEVVSLDWKWLFIYPQQGVAGVNRLVVPVGRPVEFKLTSASVMNSFFVPQLGSQIYTMAGMATRLHLQADRAGRYAGLSAQYSGAGFSDMQFVVEALPPAEFEAWVKATQGRAPVLDAARYERLAQPSQAVEPHVYGDVAPGLFDAIVGLHGPHHTGTGASAPASVKKER